jgi:excisionase family DNA binding protein
VTTGELPAWVKISQPAEYYQISEKTIRKFIAEGKLKAKKVGRQIRIEPDSLVNPGGVKYWGT